MSEHSIMDHHLVEFISKPELVSLLTNINTWDLTMTQGENYISLNSDALTVFIVAKDGSFAKEWNDENCSDHLVVHAFKSGYSWLRFEYSLLHMKLNGYGIRNLIKQEISAVVERFQTLQNAHQVHSHIQPQTQENMTEAYSSRKAS